MNLLAKIRLVPKSTVQVALLDTLEVFNQARNYVASIAQTPPPHFGYWRQRALYDVTYQELRSRFDLGAQASVLIINEIAGYAQRMEVDQARFNLHDPILYDERVLSWQFEARTVSIWTVNGRKKGVPFEGGPHQLNLLSQRRLISELIYFENEFYLFTQCRVSRISAIDLEDIEK